MRVLGPLVLLAAAVAAPAARAQCKSTTAADFEGLVSAAFDAIANDDLVGHGKVFVAMQDQLPCMDEKIPVDAWAEFLVGYAVVENALGRDWEHALDVALTIKPTVTRDFGPDEVRNYVPTARYEDTSQPRLPEEAEIYLDGRRIEHEPGPLGDVHIVQQLENGVWNTRLLMNEPFPEDWKVQFVDEELSSGPATPDLIGAVYLLGGFASGGQSLTQGIPSAGIDDQAVASALVGVGSHGSWLFERPVGLFWDLSVPLQVGTALGVEAYAGPSVGLGDYVRVHAGVGGSSVPAFEATGPRSFVLVQPHLAAQLDAPLGGTLGMELGGGGGAAPGAWHARGRWGLVGGEGLGWNAGLEFSGASALFAESGSDRRVSASLWRIGLRGGLAFR